MDPTTNTGAVAPAAAVSPDQAQIDLVNAAVRNHLSRALPSAIEQALAPVLAKLAPAAPTTSAADEKDPAKRLSALEAEHNKLLQSLAAERQKAREQVAFAELKKVMAPIARPELLDVAAERVFHLQRKIKVAEDGKATFDHDGVPLSLIEGITEWAKAKENAVFLPPPKPGAKPAPRTEFRSPIVNSGSNPGPEVHETPRQRSMRLIAELRQKSQER
jgi:hypothetical protein